MPSMEIRTQFPDDNSQALELSAVGEVIDRAIESHIDVPEDCQVLVITVTSSGEHGFLNGPSIEEIQIKRPIRGGGFTDVSAEFTEGDNGQRIYLFEEPPMGEWPITLFPIHGSNNDIEVNASALTSGWRARFGRGLRWIGCKACKYGIKAIIIALLIQIAPIIAAKLGLAAFVDQVLHVADKILEILKKAMELTNGALRKLLEFLYTLLDDPIDKIIEKICIELGFCRG